MPVPYTAAQEDLARQLLKTLIDLPDPVRIAMAHNLGPCQGALDFLAALRSLHADFSGVGPGVTEFEGSTCD